MVAPHVEEPNIRKLGWIGMRISGPQYQSRCPGVKLVGVKVIVMHWAGLHDALSQRIRITHVGVMGSVSWANVEAWHPLPGAPFRFKLRFGVTLRLRLGAGSGLPSASLFAFGLI